MNAVVVFVRRFWWLLVIPVVGCCMATFAGGGLWLSSRGSDSTAQAIAPTNNSVGVQDPGYNPTPTQPVLTPTPQPTSTPQPTQPVVEVPVAAEAVCQVIHESVVEEGMDHVSTSNAFIHVEYWFPGQPERETILDASKAGGGRYNFTRTLRGWVWEYSFGCTYEDVKAQIDAHVVRRLAGKANNAGFVAYGEKSDEVWHPTNIFVPVDPTK